LQLHYYLIYNKQDIVMITHEMIHLYDAYTHGQLSRRDFLSKLAVVAGGMTAAIGVLPALENDYTRIADNSATEGIVDEYIAYQGASGEMRAYSARPFFDPPYPVVVVIHENRGLNPYIEEVTRRVASSGFWAFAPDALSPVGGTPDDSDLARTRIGELDGEQTIQDFVAAVDFAASHADSNGKTGCVGFCWGGRMANQLAVHCQNLKAAVAFYGSQPNVTDVPKIKAAVMLHYAGLDERINAGIEPYVQALREAEIEHSVHLYEDVHHAFHNHTSATRYNEAAAKLAWQRTIAFFNVHLT
jgi:carboxymethylenebutenolidase